MTNQVQTPTRLTADVAIVGAGPCGALLANLLGGFGISTVLLDESRSIIDYPRAVGIDDEALRSLQDAGLADAVVRDVIQNVPLRMFDANGKCFADIRPTTKEFGWYRRNIFMQQLLERELRVGLTRFDTVDVRLGHRVVGLQQDTDRVELDIEVDDGTSTTVSARYVVAADGGRSTVRDLVGVTLVGDTHPRKWVVIETDHDPLDAPFTGLYCDPRRPYVCIYLPHGYRRWEFMLFDGEDADAMLEPAKVQQLLSHHVEHPDTLDIIRARVYTHHSRIADRFRSGRVLLVGDAAHLMPPWAGQGLNTGFRDVTNLGWKLAAVVDGRMNEDVLNTYDAERRAHAKAMIDLSTSLGRILSPTRLSVARARDLALRAARIVPGARNWVLQMRFKPMPYYGADGVTVHERAAADGVVGRMFPQPLVEMNGSLERLDDVLGRWFSVVGFDVDPTDLLTSEHRTQLERLGVTFVKIVRARAGKEHRAVGPDTVLVEEVDGSASNYFVDHGVGVVMVRPDRYVAIAATAGTLGAALDAFFAKRFTPSHEAVRA